MLHHLTSALQRIPVAVAVTATSLLTVGVAAAAGATWQAPAHIPQAAARPAAEASGPGDGAVDRASGADASTTTGGAEDSTGGTGGTGPVAESATTEPATTEPVTTEPATTEPAATEPATTEPATTEPPSTEPAPTTTEWHDTPVPLGIDLTCRADGTSVTCAWSPWSGDGFARFLLLRSDGTTGRVPFQTSDPAVTATIDAGLAPGSYSYVVIVLDSHGTTLVHSNGVTVQIGGSD